MGLLNWFRRKRKNRVEKEVLERTGKLQTEIEKRVKKESKRVKKQS